MTRNLQLKLNDIEDLTPSHLKHNDEGEEEYEDDDNDRHIHTYDSDEDNDCDTHFYIDLLMNLSPSMEQVHSQAVKGDLSGYSYTEGSTTLLDKAKCRILQEKFTQLMFELPADQRRKLWPKVPSPPLEASATRFRTQLLDLSKIPLKYENSAVLDEAVSVIPFEDIHGQAEYQYSLQQAQAASLDLSRPEWGYQDCVVRALLKYAIAYSHNPLILFIVVEINLTYSLGGSAINFSPMSITLHVIYVRSPLLSEALLNLIQRRKSKEPQRLSFTNAPT